MNAFRVWIRPLGSDCRVRVDGVQNANWLLDRLARSFVFKSCEPVRNERGPDCCSFRILYGPQMSRAMFERLLGTIPEVNLMTDPA
ncbi:MAG: hypothetical protein ABFD16_09345 [Thermoguttaceae bacterium]|jgi:hypothetical protein